MSKSSGSKPPKRKRDNKTIATPNCDRLAEVSDLSNEIGDFLDWLEQRKNFTLCEPAAHEMFLRKPINETKTQLLAEYFGIDLAQLEQEKLDVLKRLQQRQSKQ